jgi:hypothetical protein
MFFELNLLKIKENKSRKKRKLTTEENLATLENARAWRNGY